MKALTLYQPWATLIATGHKRIETRSWATKYRGPLAIHAGKNTGFMIGAQKIVDDEPFRSVMGNIYRAANTTPFPLGVIVATCELVWIEELGKYTWEMHQAGWRIGNHFWETSEQEKAFGDYTPGRFAWFLDDVQPLSQPISAKGAMGLWEWLPLSALLAQDERI
jgi:hypothetical protein